MRKTNTKITQKLTVRQSPAKTPKGISNNQNVISSETSVGVRCSSSRIHSNPWDHSHIRPASNYPTESPEVLDACHVDPCPKIRASRIIPIDDHVQQRRRWQQFHPLTVCILSQQRCRTFSSIEGAAALLVLCVRQARAESLGCRALLVGCSARIICLGLMYFLAHLKFWRKFQFSFCSFLRWHLEI